MLRRLKWNCLPVTSVLGGGVFSGCWRIDRDEVVEAERQLTGVHAVDEPVFLSLVQPLLPTAQRLAHAMLGSPNEAEDAVQEATLNAWAKIQTFRRGTDFKSWYLTIVANECRQALRSAWCRVILKPFVERGSSSPPQDRVDAGDEVRRALGRLSHDHQVVIVLRFYLDLSFEEIGQALCISPRTAKSRTQRALDRLRPIS
jgi:RNA polymerase sigma-70 factor (ECF subfamily)